MKNQILTLILGTALLATSPVFAMEGLSEDEKREGLAAKRVSTIYKTVAEIEAEWKEMKKRVEELPGYASFKSKYDESEKKPYIPVVYEYKSTDELLAEGAELNQRVEAIKERYESIMRSVGAALGKSLPVDQTSSDLPLNKK